MRCRSVLLVIHALALTLVSISAVAQQQEGYINIEIVNDGQYDQRITVFDDVCNLVVLERRIVANGEIAAQVCARAMDRGLVTVRNLETGAEREYRNVLDGDRLSTP
jgi:hypothetical protein